MDAVEERWSLCCRGRDGRGSDGTLFFSPAQPSLTQLARTTANPRIELLLPLPWLDNTSNIGHQTAKWLELTLFELSDGFREAQVAC